MESTFNNHSVSGRKAKKLRRQQRAKARKQDEPQTLEQQIAALKQRIAAQEAILGVGNGARNERRKLARLTI